MRHWQRHLITRWASLPLTAKAMVIFAIPAVPLALVSLITIATPSFEDGLEDQVEQTLVVKLRLNEILTTVLSGESAARGYVLSGAPELLTDYRSARRRIQQQLASLDGLVIDVPSERSLLAELTSHVTSRFELLDRTVLLVTPAAPSPTLVAAGVAVMDQVRRDVENIEAVQNRLLAARRAQAASGREQSRWIIGGTGLLGLGGGLGAVLLFAGDVRRRIARVKRNAERMSRSEPLLPARSDADEIGELDVAVRGGAALLEQRLQQLGAAQLLLDQFFDMSLDMLVIADMNGRFIRANPAWQAILGWTPEALTATRYFDFIHPDDVAETNQHAAHLAQGGSVVSFTNRYRCHDGSYRSLSWKAAADVESGRIYALARDVTEQQKAHAELQAHAKEAAQARLEAERANRAKTAFLSHMSHDLRTPLNAILGFAQLLEQDSLNAEQVDSVRHILAAGEYLLNLISEVLDISRVESGQLALSPEIVPVNEMILRATTLIEPLARQRDVTVRIHLMPPNAGVFGDRQRIHQILVNLLSNAVKYNRRGGHIDVSFEHGAPGRRRIVVADTGFGISPGKIGLLFQPFERLGAEQSAIEGTGLGLTLSRILAEAMGGTIGVASTESEGSRFWLELRDADVLLQTPASSPSLTAGPADASTIGGTVLYIEDNSANQHLMRRILRQRPNVEYLTAADGNSGLAIALQRHPQLIFVDLHLPDMTGEDILERLWQDPRTRQIPSVVLTADATPGLTKRLLAAGAKVHLSKPLKVDQVLQLVDQYATKGKAA